MKHEVKAGQTDYTVIVLFRDSTTGLSKTGLTGASAGMNAAYTRVETDNDVTIAEHATLHALATPALTDVHLDWGFIEVDATHAPGLYRLDLPDEVFATGAWSAVVSLVCTGCDTVHEEFVLVPEAPVTGVVLAPTHPAVTFAAVTVTGATTYTGTTVHTGNVSFADGITVAAPSTGNRAGVDILGNGTGPGLKVVGGATAAGLSATGGATSGPGVVATGGGNNADSDGIRATGAALADGVETNRLHVTGTTVHTGNVSHAGTTTLTGAVLLGDTLTVTSNLLVTGTSTYTGATLHTGAVTLTNGINAGAISGTLANGIITAAAIANGAIDNATFAADVGSTAGATNIIALAVDKSLELAKVPKSDGVVTWNATALASVNTQVADVVNTDALAEVATVPAANAALSAKVNYLFALARNKRTTTAAADVLRDDADGATIATSVISDNGVTFTRGKYA